MTLRSALKTTAPAASTLLALLTLSAAAQTTAPHRRASASTAHKSTSVLPAAPVEGLAAAGTMPAVTGSVKPLYTLRYVDLQTGTGDLAQPNKFYTVHYTGWLLNGTKFDSSVDRNESFVFPAGAHRVIMGWDTGFEGMRIGGKRRLIVPYQLAYGEAGRPPVIPAKSDLIFDVEFIAQSDTPPQRPAPAPPAGATPPSADQTRPAQQPGTNPVTKPAEKPE